MKYIMSDIHGNWDKYKSILQLIEFSEEDEIYIIGDVIDRGAHGIEILMDIRKHSNVHLIMGNHELMAVQTLLAKDEREWEDKLDLWIMNGGGVTYCHFLALSEAEQGELAAFLATLPDSMEIKIKGRTFHLVHGFPANTLKKQVWTRPTLKTPNPFTNKTLIIGHTPVMLLHGDSDKYIRKLRKKGKHVKIKHAEGFIDIDCGCGSGVPEGRLACLRLDDMKEFYV
ncbi:MAG: metallophosphoesterase [Lachnospiraceae bacterium]|nr:metallophosphoesterase [Lachnospiraceae bacterium]